VIGYDGEAVGRQDRRDQAGQAGDVHRHNRKGTQDDPAKADRVREVSKMESEHVVPWGWIQAVISAMFDRRLPGQKDASAYPRMTTVMTYERAAELKTSQLANNDAEFKRWISGVGPSDARRTIADHLPSLVRSRMQIIKSATSVYVAKVQREDGISLPERPDDAAITRATAGQLAEIFAALREAR